MSHQVDELHRQAFELHLAGRLAEAEQLYRQILAAAPTYAPTLHMLGVMAAQNHQADAAVGFYRQAIAANPHQPGYHHSLGEVYRAAGQIDQAGECYRRALELDANFELAHFSQGLMRRQHGDQAGAQSAFAEVVRLNPGNVAAHHELGELLRAEGRRDEALVHLRRVRELRGDSAEAHANLGSLLQEMGRLDEAIGLLETATRMRPDLMPAHFNLGNALRSAGRHADAAAAYRRAVALAPGFAQAHNNLGSALRALGDEAAARNSYSAALRYGLDSAEAHFNLGALLCGAGEYAEARRLLARAVELDPHYGPAHFHLGSACLKLKEWDAARSCFHTAIQIAPNYAEPHASLGLLCMASGQPDEAGRHFDAALAIQSDLAEAHCDRGMLLLSAGDDAAGWLEFEWFAKCHAYSGRKFRQPAWDGSPLDGRTLLVLCDQSLGDTIQFVRYLPWLRETAGGPVVFAAQRALLPLLRGSGFEDVVALDEPPVRFDVHTSIMLLPALHYAARGTIDAAVPYLRADDALMDKWSQRLADRAELKVGLVWQGNVNYPWDEWRSIPLEQFAPLAEVSGVRLISLQHGPGRDQLATLPAERQIADLGDEVDRDTGAFMDTAAIIRNLDLVITSDTSTAHLAGGLGAPVWVALSLAPEFRWQREGEACRWYPNMRLFRQSTMGDWGGVMRAIAERLAQRVAARPQGGP